MKIERILKVVDTRQYEEGPDDKWYPIVGSGHEHACARCGRMHEIHAMVLLDDGNEAVVGTGCASKENTEMAARSCVLRTSQSGWRGLMRSRRLSR